MAALLFLFCVSNMECTRAIVQPSFGDFSSAGTCPVSELVRAEPPRDPIDDPFGLGPWYVNADRSIWAGWDAGRWVSGPNGNKVLWIRPQGAYLLVSGRRIDGGDATPLKADIPCCYPTGFQPSRVYFPTAGCWEVAARAGSSELKFITEVS